MRSAALFFALLLVGADGKRISRRLMDVPMERMFLDMCWPVSETFAMTSTIGYPTRPKDAHELIGWQEDRRRLIFAVGVEFHFE